MTALCFDRLIEFVHVVPKQCRVMMMIPLRVRRARRVGIEAETIQADAIAFLLWGDKREDEAMGKSLEY
jgi:hypothetical protein